MRARLLFIIFILSIASTAMAREEINLDSGWKFLRSDAAGASDRNFDDSSWEIADLPHTWNSKDATGGVGTYYRGVGWYRQHVTIKPQQINKAIYLWFGAAGSAADVFINGQPAGSHKGAFAAFCFDIKSLLSVGDNVIAVRVTNARDEEIAPLSGDFNVQGGLYRNAKLLVLEPLSISPLDHASSGVFVKQVNITDQSADLEITTLLRNLEPADVAAAVKCTITDAAGKTIVSDILAKSLAAGASDSAIQKITVANPHLWNGRSDPYLYTVSVEVSQDGRVTDRVSVPLGLRYYRVDPHLGFFLNGKPYDLHGVNRHQDFAGKGWAITSTEMQTDIDLLKELGCTMVRLAHYQHSPLFYEMCDRAGLIVWAELCLVNEARPTPRFHEVTRQQLTELIRQNYNHPSICFWSLYNEMQFFGDALEHDLQLVRDMNKRAHELDSTRLTTAASDQAIEHPGNWITDTVAFNKYYGWYYDTVNHWPGKIDQFRAFDPSRGFGFSEYGAGASVKQHEADPKNVVYNGKWHPEEWQNIVHEKAYQAMAERPYVWCKLIWVFADFAIATRTEGDTIGMNDKGIVTFDRKTKKDAFYFYKANWSEGPMVYITSRRFTPRPQAASAFKIYSNCDNVELKVNGQSLGTRTSADRILVWDNVTLKPGENRIEAVGAKGGQTFTDSCTILHDPAATPQR